jgi:phosphoglycerate kinase
MIETLDDLDPKGKLIGIRVDINSPLIDGDLSDDIRLRSHLETLSELVSSEARIVLMAHQGRPGEDSCISLQPHSLRLADLLDIPVHHVESTYSKKALDKIKQLPCGEILVLENTRFCPEEYVEMDPKTAAKTKLVSALAPLFDAYVNDAFGSSHRSHPSLVGFPYLLPSYAGRLLEKELKVLGTIHKLPRPRVYFLAGKKTIDSLAVAESVLERNIADEVLAAGLFGNFLLYSAGFDLGAPSMDILRINGILGYLNRGKSILANYGDQIKLPIDVAIDSNGRHEILVSDLPAEGPIFDIGSQTINEFSSSLESASTTILNGPAGLAEVSHFSQGTIHIYDAATQSDTSIVGGGDTMALLDQFGISNFSHISTGGGAAMKLLSGDSLPAVAALALRNS